MRPSPCGLESLPADLGARTPPSGARTSLSSCNGGRLEVRKTVRLGWRGPLPRPRITPSAVFCQFLPKTGPLWVKPAAAEVEGVSLSAMNLDPRLVDREG